jgi:hypothetical protein
MKDFVLTDGDYRFEEVFDMSQAVSFNGIDYMILNKSKFGILWWLMNTGMDYQKIILPDDYISRNSGA